MKGKSEELIGKVLKENPQYEAFVVTKSGYDDRENLPLLKEGGTWNEIIHPDFLRNRIALSLSRLSRTAIDGFLLHSPESYLNPTDIQPFPDGFYAGIKRAFEFLEEQTRKGTIRYYGISSNTLHLSVENPDTINLHRVLAIANEISTSHHFKLIEFPFNLGEMDALKRHHGQTSLIQFARDNGIVTLTNRPLNAKTSLGPVRLAIYKDYEQLLDYRPDCRVWDDSLKLIAKRLKEIGAEDELMNFAIVRHLDEFWTTIGNPEGVIQIFQNYFHPFLHHIYQGNIPNEDAKVYLDLYEAATLCSRRTMTQKTLEFQRMLTSEGTIQRNDHRPLPVVACELYLNSGIDHVLMGMRKREYVNMVSSLF
jgi:aryl-alcohol dehydrogenase-like predicted oxidoreductase